MEQTGTPPALLPVKLEGIPEDLKKIDQWVVWEADWVEDNNLSGGYRLRMVPCDAVTKKPFLPGASEPINGASFEVALAAYEESRYSGIGFMLTDEDPFVVIQIADALSGDGLPRIEATRVLRSIYAYAEQSPDGMGLTLILRGNLPPGGCRRDTIELAETERFVPVTGWHLPDSQNQIVDRQKALEEYHSELFPAPPKRFIPQSNIPAISDDEVLKTAFNASNGGRIQQLFKGETGIIPGDRNAADLALCSMLGFFTGNDAARLDRLFRRSALYRDKWDNIKYSNGKTYGEATVAKALEGCLIFHSYPVHAPQPAANAKPAADTFRERTVERGSKRRRTINADPVEPEEAMENFTSVLSISHDGPMSIAPSANGNPSSANPMLLPVASGENINPIIFAEQMGRAEGLAQRETVLNAREAAHLLKISPKLLRRTVKPWRRFGGSPAGDRWLLSDLLSKITAA